jgi:hypothetical protein
MFPTPGQYAREAGAHIAAMADPERVRRLEAFELLWSGQCYHGRPSFWDATVPLRERAPAVQSGVLRASGNRLAHMVFGERAFPVMHVERQAFGIALEESDQDALSALVGEIVHTARLRSRSRAYLLEGLKVGTSVALVELRAGRPALKILPAKWCTATFDECGKVTHLVIQYRYRHGADECWYRREIGDGFDRVRASVRVSGTAVDWSKVAIESERAIDFVPVVWTRCGSEAVEEDHCIDGHPLCEGIEDEILALDMELSQLYRTALYNGEPQLVRVGVQSGTGTGAPMGAEGRVAAEGAGSFAFIQSLLPKGWTFGRERATQKAPGKIWDLPAGADAKMLESSGAGADIIKRAIDEYRRIVTDSIGVVIADPQTLGKGDLSARALSLMFGPMLDTASSLRVDYGDALCAIIDMMLRLVASQPSGVYLATAESAREALAKLYAPVDGVPTWMGCPIALQWGEFFEPSWTDVTAAVDAAQKATGGRPVLSQRAALRLVAPVVGVDDLDAEAGEIEREMGADHAAMRDTVGAMQPAPEAQETVLSDSQVAALMTLAEKVAARAVPLESAVRIAVRGFGLSEGEAREMLAPADAQPPPAPTQVTP